MTALAAIAEDAAKLLDLIDGKWTTQAVGAAAELGIADLLAAGPLGLDALAYATGCEPTALRRLLRALETLGVCRKRDDGDYELGTLGTLLKSEGTPSLRSWALWSARYHWAPWGQLAQCVRSGESARGKVAGGHGYAPADADPAAPSIFNQAMVDLTRLIAEPVARACDFSAASRVVDVGGGHGELLFAILAAHPHIEGVLFDLPHAIQDARSRIAAKGLAARCVALAGSFFESVPGGCDAYVLKSVLHNWDDGHCALILEQCRRAMPAGARVLLVERVMPRSVTGAASDRLLARSDLNMLVGLGGRERTQEEFRGLLEASGFEARGCVPIGFGFSVIEGHLGTRPTALPRLRA